MCRSWVCQQEGKDSAGRCDRNARRGRTRRRLPKERPLVTHGRGRYLHLLQRDVCERGSASYRREAEKRNEEQEKKPRTRGCCDWAAIRGGQNKT